MTPVEIHTAVLAALTALERTARAAQPFGAWYYSGSQGVEGTTRIPTDQPVGAGRTAMALLSPDEMADLDEAELEDWIFTAATTADGVHIATWHPQAVLTMLAGRRRILERHEPVERSKAPQEPPFCGACIDRPDYRGGTAADWPCDDYRDAAADLLTALETT